MESVVCETESPISMTATAIHRRHGAGCHRCAFVDTLTPAERSAQMSLVRSKNTKPELLLRRLLFSLGYRYRLHSRDLPGRPDLVFPMRRKIIFLHGCFWHGHSCPLGRMPKSRIGYWTEKIAGNSARDQLNLHRLRGMRWKCLVVWECQVRRGRDRAELLNRLTRFLEK